MKKLLLVLAFSLPLTAQEADYKKVETESIEKRVVKKLQDWEWKKFDAAHKRAHMRGGKQHSQCPQCTQHSKRAKMVRKHKTKQWIKTLVIGGVAYYIGYTQGQKHEHKHKHGWNKPMPRGEK